MTRAGYALKDPDGALFLPEITTPTPVVNFGKLYTKTNDKLYFQDGAGSEKEVSLADTEHGSMFANGNATATTITDANKVVAIEAGSSTDLSGVTFNAGTNGVIANTADNGGTLRITDVGHGLVTGDVVSINGLATAAQNAVTLVTRIDDDTFDCDDITFVTGSESGTWQKPGHLVIGTAGTYLLTAQFSVLSASANKTFQFFTYIGSTQQTDITSERRFASNDIGAMGMGGLIAVSATDKVWCAVVGLTDATNITVKHSNFSIHRI